MNQELICELNLAVIPEESLADKHIALSKQMAKKYPPVIQLSSVTRRLAFTPHITIYQVPIRVRDLAAMSAALARVAAKTPAFALAATEFGANSNEGSFEVRYEAAGRLMQFQVDVLAIVNPLRGDLLLERDPAGHPLKQLIEKPGTIGDNIRRTGFDAVGDPAKGGTFGPHVTINWFDPGTSVNLKSPDLPSLADFNGRFVALGVFLLGPCGTCVQRMASLDLGS